MVWLIKFFDKYLGAPICLVLSLFTRKKKISKPKRVLFTQLWGVGETVCTLPAVKALKEKLNLKVDVLATSRNKDVYESSGLVDRVIVSKLGFFPIIGLFIKYFKRYDLVVDFEEYLNISSIMAFFIGKQRVGFSHGIRSWLYNKTAFYEDNKHCSEAFFDLVRLMGVKAGFKELVKLKTSAQDKKTVDSFLKKNKLKRVVGMVPGAAESCKARMWPKERFAKLADKISDKYKVDIVFIGSKEERKLVNEIQAMMKNKSFNAAGLFPWKQTFYLLEKCALVVSNDTGPMHAAAAMGTKTIGFFGPNLPERFGPYGKKNIGIYKGKICRYSPCINVHKGQVPDCRFSRRSSEYQKCMKEIVVEDVFKHVKGLIK